jgi:hypothetical protein
MEVLSYYNMIHRIGEDNMQEGDDSQINVEDNIESGDGYLRNGEEN